MQNNSRTITVRRLIPNQMSPITTRIGRITGCVLMAAFCADLGFAGISRAIQDKYRREYENKALFLKVPVFSEKQYIFIAGRNVRQDQNPATGGARFKVGDQVRILGLDFGGDEIRFKIGAIQGAGGAEIIFKFDSALVDSFPNSDSFDAALAATFTEGLKLSDLDEAKRGYVEQQFESMVREIASTTGASREFVLKSIAGRMTSYQDAQRDVENLKGRNQDLAGQLGQAQSEIRRLESELRQQQGEATRLKNSNAALQEKIDGSTSQLARLGEDLRSARGQTQNYQSQLANLQRSLNLKVDEHRDLASQISELGQAMKKLQKDNDALESQNSTLRTNLQNTENANKRLAGDVEDLKASNAKLHETIDTLSSKEDSLARQYLDLKKTKENLENVTRSVESLTTQIAEERSAGGVHTTRASVSLRNIPLGSLEWRLPEFLSPNEAKTAELTFASESIDYVKVTPEERHLLKSLGERLKFGVKLSSAASTIEVKPEKDSPLQEVRERDRATWRWSIQNRGTQDARLLISVYTVNKNSDEIPVLKQEQLVLSSSVVRQFRSYLQPIPMAAGAIIGFLFFGIVGVIRRGKKSPEPGRVPALRSPETAGYIKQKQL